MADTEDLKHVMSGSLDLVGCVLDGADLSGLDLQARDFSGAFLKRTDFSNALLSGSSFQNAKHAHAIFFGANLKKTTFDSAIFGLDFRQSDLRNANFSGLLTKCDFRGANLCDADFSKARLSEDCNFEDVVFNEGTRFEGTTSLRSYLRFELLKGYAVERGILRRIQSGEAAHTHSEDEVSALKTIAEGRRLLALVTSDVVSEGTPGIGHNGPPESFMISQAESEAAIALFDAASEQIESGEKDGSILHAAAQKAAELGKAAVIWCARKCDLAADEFAKNVGATLGSKTALFLLAFQFSGAMELIHSTLQKFL